MRLKYLSLIFCSSLLLSEDKSLPTTLNEFYNLFYLHQTGTLNQRLGDLKSYPLRDGLWLRSEFVEQSTRQSSSLSASSTQSVLSTLGYDHAFNPQGGVDFLGFYVDYAYSWLPSSSYAHSIALALYNTFITSSHFYIDTALKYTMLSPQSTSLSTKTLAHLLGGSIEIGQRFTFSSIFFLQPLLKSTLGFIPSITLTSTQATLKTDHTMPFFIKAGGYMGINYLGAIKGDIRFGAFFDGDFFFFSSPTLAGSSLSARQNYRLNLELSTNIFAGRDFRIYLGAQSSFFGESNINYGVNLGMRFIFGQSLYRRPPRPSYNSGRTISSVQQNLRYEGDASIARVEERTHLSNEQVEEKYTTQAKRNSPFVQDDIKYAKRQRYLRETSQWVDIKKNEENYQNRNAPQMQTRDVGSIRDYSRRELERKYGKE